jgi:hypothetical protein
MAGVNGGKSMAIPDHREFPDNREITGNLTGNVSRPNREITGRNRE